MAMWTHLENFDFLDKDEAYEIQKDNVCSDEPMNLKLIDENKSIKNTLSDLNVSKLVKTKAFRIKDILGLDENEQLTSTPDYENSFTVLRKSSTITSNHTGNIFI